MSYPQRLSPIVKWAGGKERELKHITPRIPRNYRRYFEPFVGGGAVFFSTPQVDRYINDKSHELIQLYTMIQRQDATFLNMLEKINHHWKKIEQIPQKHHEFFEKVCKKYRLGQLNETALEDSILEFTLRHANTFEELFVSSFNIKIERFLHSFSKSIINKIKRIAKLESQKGALPEEDIIHNIESAIKSAFYTHFRHLYNNQKKYGIDASFSSAIFFYIRSYAYSGMFRYNAKGDFNVPYGGIGYNRKYLDQKIAYFKSNELQTHMQNVAITSQDFESFFTDFSPQKEDFIFLDPPYDSEFSTYAKNSFTRDDQTRLANYLTEECKANWLMVIKNTEFIHSLYSRPGVKMESFEKKYQVSFMDRNDKEVTHLIITNY